MIPNEEAYPARHGRSEPGSPSGVGDGVTSPPPAPDALWLDEIEAALENSPNAHPIRIKEIAAWLEEFKLPLAGLATNQIVGAVANYALGKGPKQLAKLYAGMTNAQLNAVAVANAEALSAIADERMREAGILLSLQQKLSHGAASLLLQGMVSVL